MAEKIKLVRGDTRPQILVALKDDSTGEAMDISNAVARLKFRAIGSTTILATLVSTLLPGKELDDGTVVSSAPYNVPGFGGRCVFAWAPGDLEQAPGDYEGEIEITFADDTVQTVFETLKFKLRDQF